MKRSGCVFGFFAFSVVAVVVALVFRALGPQPPDPWGDKPRPRVVVTLPPLACFVRNIAGSNVSLACLCTEQGPAAYEPTDADAMLLGRADLFLAIGLEIDDRLADSLHQKSSGVRFRKLGEKLPTGLGSNLDDPRVWLGLSRAVVLVQRTRDELKAIDPAHGNDYARNADRYVAQLRSAETAGKKLVEVKKDRRFLSLQGSLRHFADNFGLKASSLQVGANDTNSPDFEAVLKECTEDGGVRVLAAPPGFARSAAALELSKALQQRKASAALVEVDPLETAKPEDLARPDYYLDKLTANLGRILKHLP